MARCQQRGHPCSSPFKEVSAVPIGVSSIRSDKSMPIFSFRPWYEGDPEVSSLLVRLSQGSFLCEVGPPGLLLVPVGCA